MAAIDEGTVRLHDVNRQDPTSFEKYTYAQFEKAADKPLEWCVEGLIPRVGVTLLVGDAMIGKSRFVNGIIAARSKPVDGDHLAGLKVRPGRTALLSLEHAPQSIARGLKQARQGRGLKTLDLIIYRNRPPIDLKNPLRVSCLMEELDRDNVDLIVFDSLRRVAGFNENKSDEVNEIMTILNMLTNDCRAILILHHLTKGTSTPRGSGDLTASSDSVLKMSRVGGLLKLQAEHHDAENVDLFLQASHVADQLVFTQVEGAEQVEDVQGLVLAYVTEHPDCTISQIREVVVGDNKAIGHAVGELERMGAIVNTGSTGRKKWSRA